MNLFIEFNCDLLWMHMNIYKSWVLINTLIAYVFSQAKGCGWFLILNLIYSIALMREYGRQVAASKKRSFDLALDIRACKESHLVQGDWDLLKPLHFELILEIVEIQTIGNEDKANILLSLQFFEGLFILFLPLVIELEIVWALQYICNYFFYFFIFGNIKGFWIFNYLREPFIALSGVL